MAMLSCIVAKKEARGCCMFSFSYLRHIREGAPSGYLVLLGLADAQLELSLVRQSFGRISKLKQNPMSGGLF